MMKPSSLPLALLLAAAALLPACVLSSSSHVEHRGRTVSDETLHRIEPGQGKDHVLALLGEPSKRQTLDGGMELWTWTSTKVERSEAAVIFVLKSNRSVETQRRVFVELKDDVVVRAWRE
jgi:outer membrane protein assembly factor BamE (lipoprotein component of BamABCDE complex)